MKNTVCYLNRKQDFETVEKFGSDFQLYSLVAKMKHLLFKTHSDKYRVFNIFLWQFSYDGGHELTKKNPW